MREWLSAWRSSDGNGVTYVNTLAVKVDATGPDLEELTAAQAAEQTYLWLGNEYKAMLRTGYTLHDVTVHELLNNSPEVGQYSVEQPGTLGNIGGFLPREVCLVLSWKSSLATRSGRGRIFVPSPMQDSYLSSPDVWNVAGDYWIAAGAFGDKVLAGRTVTVSAVEYHLSGRIYSRVRQETIDITGYVRRSQPHWLRSRAR